jgi:hypothetical protein
MEVAGSSETKLNSITYQDTVIFIFTAVRRSNLKVKLVSKFTHLKDSQKFIKPPIQPSHFPQEGNIHNYIFKHYEIVIFLLVFFLHLLEFSLLALYCEAHVLTNVKCKS